MVDPSHSPAIAAGLIGAYSLGHRTGQRHNVHLNRTTPWRRRPMPGRPGIHSVASLMGLIPTTLCSGASPSISISGSLNVLACTGGEPRLTGAGRRVPDQQRLTYIVEHCHGRVLPAPLQRFGAVASHQHCSVDSSWPPTGAGWGVAAHTTWVFNPRRPLRSQDAPECTYLPFSLRRELFNQLSRAASGCRRPLQLRHGHPQLHGGPGDSTAARSNLRQFSGLQPLAAVD